MALQPGGKSRLTCRGSLLHTPFIAFLPRVLLRQPVGIGREWVGRFGSLPFGQCHGTGQSFIEFLPGKIRNTSVKIQVLLVFKAIWMWQRWYFLFLLYGRHVSGNFGKIFKNAGRHFVLYSQKIRQKNSSISYENFIPFTDGAGFLLNKRIRRALGGEAPLFPSRGTYAPLHALHQDGALSGMPTVTNAIVRMRQRPDGDEIAYCSALGVFIIGVSPLPPQCCLLSLYPGDGRRCC